ncbi:hypothetical protein BOX15_Mlig007270g1 [Macrostomum lignano]|uniref:Uncharacterized protein n=1 Tax=Macrostomum lignano TaxID=282301 RepID=A0A267H6W4_9PLAT|nr:hypothetical protein BOX15_Mlig007270g1 [Macrostomum lignano]
MSFIALIALSHMVIASVLAASGNDPVITNPPTAMSALRGTSLSLTCTAVGDPKPRITWYNATSGRQVHSMSDDPVHSMIHLDSSGKLTFLSFEAKFEGRYYCNASNEHGSTVSDPVWARIAYLNDKFRSEPQSKSVPTGSTIEIECDPPDGQPRPEVSWRKNGQSIVPEDGRIVVMDNGHLRIMRAGPSDAGEYACRAKNIAGDQLSASAIISVKSKPVFRVAPSDLDRMQGENATFNCAAVGDPAPTLNWRKDNGQIVKSRSFSHSNGSLTVFNLAPTDAGKYICEASNSAGTNEALATLTVRFKPEFRETPVDQVAVEGHRVVFRCRVVGNPKPNIFWSQDKGMYIFPNNAPNDDEKLRGVNVTTDGSLVIDPVRPIHQGKYECHANSYAGSVQSSATLTVTARAALAPIISVGPQSQSVTRGQDLQLNCELDLEYQRAHARFNPQTIWYKDSVPIRKTNRFHVNYDGSLKIYELQPSDRGNYTCAIKVGGKVTTWPTPAIIDVVNYQASPDGMNRRRPDVSDLPRPPRSIAVTDKGADWVLLKVTPRSSPAVPGSELVRYQVEYLSHDLGTGWQLYPHLFESETLKVDGLRSQTSYQFLVRTVTSRGVSKPSTLSPPVHTEAETPTDKFGYSEIPQHLQNMGYKDFRLQVMKKDVVRVLWKVQARQNTLELTHGFHINYRVVPLHRCIDDNKVFQQYKNSHCSLKNEQRLNYHLRSRLDRPDTRASDVDASSSSAAEASSGGGGEHSPSYARQQTKTISWRYNKKAASANTVSATLSDLMSFSCYEVTVENFNKQAMYGETRGSRSEPHTVLTWEYFPTKPPSNIRASWLSNTSLSLSWTPPPVTDSNGILTGFVIHLREPASVRQSQQSSGNSTSGLESRLVWRTISINNGSANSHVITGLDPAADYTLHLAAVNCQGEGTRSPPLRIPSAIYSLSAAQEKKTLLKEPWFISIMVIGILLWLAVCAVVIFAFRTRCLHRKKPYYKPYNKGVGGGGSGGCGSVDASGNAFPLLSKSSGGQDDSSNGSRFTGGVGHGSGHQLSGELHQQSPPPPPDLLDQQQQQQHQSAANKKQQQQQQQQLFANSPMHIHHMQQQTPLLMLGHGGPVVDQMLPAAPMPPPATLPSVAPVATPYASASLIQSAIQQDRRYQQGSLYSNADEPACSMSCSDCSDISDSTAAVQDHHQHQHQRHVMTSSGGAVGNINFPSYKPPAMNICDFTPPPPPLSDLVSGGGGSGGSSRCPYYTADYQQQQPACKSGSQSSESAAPSCYANCAPASTQQQQRLDNKLVVRLTPVTTVGVGAYVTTASNSSSCSPNFGPQGLPNTATTVQQGRGGVISHHHHPGFPASFPQQQQQQQHMPGQHHPTMSGHRDSPAPSSLLGEADSNRSWPSNINSDVQQQQQQQHRPDGDDLLEDDVDDCEYDDEDDLDDDMDVEDGESVAQPACSTSSSSSEEGVHEDDARRGLQRQPQHRQQRQQRQQHPHGGHPPQRHHQPQAPAHYLQHHGTTPNYDRLFHSSGGPVSVAGGGGGPASPLVGGPSSRRRRTRQQQQQNLQQQPRPASPYSTDSNYSALPSAPHRPYPKSERKKQLRSYGAAPNGVSNGGNNASNSNRRPSVPRQSHPPLPPTPPLDQLPIV